MSAPLASTALIPIRLAPAIGPVARVDVAVPCGATVLEIVHQVVPAHAIAIGGLRVTLVDGRGVAAIAPDLWRLVRPRPGVQVIITAVPAGNALRGILQIVVMVAAAALGQWWAPALAGATGLSVATSAALITAGTSIVGMLAINALVPPTSAKKEKNRYQISTLRNAADPDGPFRVLFGRMRIAPVYAAPPYTEVVGDLQYVRVILCWGYGPVAISDIEIAATSIDEYDEFEIEHRTGTVADEPVTLYPRQVVEEQLGVELTRDYPRDDTGEVIDGEDAVEKEVIRYSAVDCSEISLIVAFPQGLVIISADGSDKKSMQVAFRIRVRPIGGGDEDWTTVTEKWTCTGKSEQSVLRQYNFTPPARGAWEVGVTRLTDESLRSRVRSTSIWQAIQSIRPEYPLNIEFPVALTALRIKATHQINGAIDTITGIASRIAPDWDEDTQTWIERETRSPAAALRWLLQGPATSYPLDDGDLDLDRSLSGSLPEWSVWCAAHGLKYDRLHDTSMSVFEAAQEIAAAGRATIRTGAPIGLIIDRPTTRIIDHISPRNARGITWTRTYPQLPHAFRVRFADETTEKWDQSERLVPIPGHTGDITITEALELRGKTDPDEIWIEARRRGYEAIHRPDVYEATQDGMARVVKRGDRVLLSWYVLSRQTIPARVSRVVDAIVELDEDIEAEAGVDWGMRWIRDVVDDASQRESVTRRVVVGAPRTRVVRIDDQADEPIRPVAGDIVLVGPLTLSDGQMIVTGVESGERGSAIVKMIPAGDQIDALLDAETPPAWDGRVGGEITVTPGATTTPTVPLITSIETGIAGMGDAGGLTILLTPGPGSYAVASYVVHHRLVGGSTWDTTSFSAGEGGGSISGYTSGDEVALYATAMSAYGDESAPTATVTVTIGSGDVEVPGLAVEVLADGTRRYAVTVDDARVTGYRLSARPGTGWTIADLTPIHGGYLTASPYETAEPQVPGTWTIGVELLDADDVVVSSATLAAELTTSAPGATVVSRIESVAGWDGAVLSGTLTGGEIVATSGSPPTASYRTPIIDLGADMAATIAAAAYGVDGVTTAYTMRTGLAVDGTVTGAAHALGPTTARYVQVTATITGKASAVLGDLTTIITN